MQEGQFCSVVSIFWFDLETRTSGFQSALLVKGFYKVFGFEGMRSSVSEDGCHASFRRKRVFS